MADYRSNLVISVDSKGVVTGTANLKALQTQTEHTRKATENFGKASNKVYGGWTSKASQIKTVGRDLSRYITLPLLAAGGASIKFALDLSKGLGNIETLIPESGERIYDLKEAILETSTQTGKTFDDLTEGMYQTISAFEDGADTVGRFNAAVTAGIAGRSSTSEAIQLLSAVTKAYGDTSTEAAEKVSDLAFETVRLGQTTFKELATGIQQATDSADRLGVSQEELFAVFATLTGVIGDSAEVATKFRSASASLLNPTEDLKDLYQELGVTSGEALIKQRGLLGAFQVISDSAEKSGIPLQRYIKRIEGITLVSRLSASQASDYTRKLADIRDYAGASEQALEQFTGGINENAFSLERLIQSLKVMGSQIGDIILPYLIDAVEGVTSLARAFTELSDGTQRFLLHMAGAAMLFGPVLNFIGSLIKFFVVLGPMFKSAAIGIGAVITKLQILAGFIATDGFLAVLKTFPVLLGGAMTGGAISIGILFAALLKVSNQYAETAANADSLTSIMDDLKGKTEEQTLAVYNEAIARQRNKIALLEESEARIQASASMAKGFGTGDTSAISQMLENEKAKLDELVSAYDNAMGKITNTVDEGMLDLKKLNNLPSWQQVFMDVAGVDKQLFQFQENQGRKAAELYLQGFADTFADEKLEAETFFKPFDDKALYQKEFDSILTTIKGLLAETDINEPFEMTDISIQTLLARLKELRALLDANGGSGSIGELLAQDLDLVTQLMMGLGTAENIYKIKDAFSVAGDEIDFLQSQLDMATSTLDQMLLVGGYTDAQIKTVVSEILRYTDAIAQAEKKTDDLWVTWQEGLHDLMEKGLMSELIGMSENVANEFANIGDAIASWGVDLLSNSFYELGQAIAQSVEEGDRFNNMLANTAAQLLKTLPGLMVQAGLNLLANGNALGWGLIAAGLSGQVISGLVDQTITNRQNEIDASANALGNAYSGGNIIPFATGGAFTNTIVDSPTLFPFANGTGLMGEAGPKAIMPLTRTATGELGVRSQGGGNVAVIINNNSGAQVTTEERQGANGKELYVTIGKVVKGQMANGEYDKSLRSRYGVKPMGVSA